MAEPAEGFWKCRVLSGEANADDMDVVRVRINVEITYGPDKGRRVTYEDQINNRSAKYIVQSARAVGWRGVGLIEDTLRADVDAWIKSTGGESTVEIKHLVIKSGKRAGEVWGKANSIGRGPKPLKTPSREASNDANEAMRAALAESGGGGGSDDVQPPSDDDIPFISCAPSADPSPIAKVLR